MIFDITASMVKQFKNCPRRYELEYVYNLKPKTPAGYLTTGTSYHSKVEAILKGEEWDQDGVTGAMAAAFQAYSGYEEWNVKGVEVEFMTPIKENLMLRGRMDAVIDNGTPLEHKTFGGGDWDKYVNHLAWDDQATLYMLAAGTNRCIYTVCKKPTIRLKKGETEEEYCLRCWDWYRDGGEEKFKVFNVTRAKGEIEAARNELIRIKDAIMWGHFYRNPQACALVSCPYESVCLSYRGEIIPVGFEKKMKRSEELCAF